MVVRRTMSTTAARQSPARLARLGLTGCLAGALATLAGCHWTWFVHEEDELEICDDIYADCMEYAVTAEDKEWCQIDVESCYEACEASWDDDELGEDDYGDDDADGESSSSTTSVGDDDGDGDTYGTTDEGEGETTTTTGDDIPQVCFDLHANCIGEAETLEDVEACEALFEQCAHPGECPSCGCPEGTLDACLDTYAACTAAALSEADIDACAADFDACTAPFADECAVEDNPNLDVCLAQHELCVACAENDEQVAACKTVFDSCMNGVQQ